MSSITIPNENIYTIEKESKAQGYVYCINSNNKYYKFGITKDNPYKRMYSMQTGNPIELKLEWAFKHYAYKELERRLHMFLVEYNTIGEWFKLDSSQVYEIEMEIKNDTIFSFIRDEMKAQRDQIKKIHSRLKKHGYDKNEILNLFNEL